MKKITLFVNVFLEDGREFRNVEFIASASDEQFFTVKITPKEEQPCISFLWWTFWLQDIKRLEFNPKEETLTF